MIREKEVVFGAIIWRLDWKNEKKQVFLPVGKALLEVDKETPTKLSSNNLGTEPVKYVG